MTESWKPIPGYEGWYEVSDHGRVRSLDRTTPRKRSGRMIALSKDGKGYFKVSLCKNGTEFTAKVHKLVAQTFLPDPVGELWVLHRNGDQQDNRAENLYWGTPSDNMKDSVAHRTHIEANKTHCPRHHQLSGLNLVPSQSRLGKRSCLACAKTHNKIQISNPKFQQVADEFYLEIRKRESCQSQPEN